MNVERIKEFVECAESHVDDVEGGGCSPEEATRLIARALDWLRRAETYADHALADDAAECFIRDLVMDRTAAVERRALIALGVVS
jgi:hypothetical protein